MKCILPVIFLSGCSALGDLELLNDVGLGDAREVISVYNATRNVLGKTTTSPNAAVINRAYGHTQNMNIKPNGVSDIPFVVRDVQELFRYMP